MCHWLLWCLKSLSDRKRLPVQFCKVLRSTDLEQVFHTGTCASVVNNDIFVNEKRNKSRRLKFNQSKLFAVVIFTITADWIPIISLNHGHITVILLLLWAEISALIFLKSVETQNLHLITLMEIGNMRRLAPPPWKKHRTTKTEICDTEIVRLINIYNSQKRRLHYLMKCSLLVPAFSSSAVSASSWTLMAAFSS